jgi:3-phosphoshikimate 1-carboxyvinyltransferase
MLAAVSKGVSHIQNLPAGEDVAATRRCMEALGARVTPENGSLVISGGDLRASETTLDAGNSGTTTRLMAGILAGQSFASRIDGDGSLRRRPMSRVIDPLRAMGAEIDSDAGRLPLNIDGRHLRGISYRLPVASAQVKSCVLLAGLFARGRTTVEETIPSRDHTERMLRSAGVQVSVSRGECLEISLNGGQQPKGLDVTVPGDMSSAAFLFAASALLGTSVVVQGVGVNPTRTGFLGILERMGCTVRVANERLTGGEPVADVEVRGPVRVPVTIGAADVPGLVDELPLVALLATATPGQSTVTGAAELRVKETDRIAAVAEQLRLMGAEIEELPDGFLVTGRTSLTGSECSSLGDHRLAMMLAVAGLCARGETVVHGAESARVSFPAFADVLNSLGGIVRVE